MGASAKNETCGQDLAAQIFPNIDVVDLPEAGDRIAESARDVDYAMRAIAAMTERFSIDVDLRSPITTADHDVLYGISLLAKLTVAHASAVNDFADRANTALRQ